MKDDQKKHDSLVSGITSSRRRIIASLSIFLVSGFLYSSSQLNMVSSDYKEKMRQLNESNQTARNDTFDLEVNQAMSNYSDHILFSSSTGNASVWEPLPFNLLSSYFHPVELEGIKHRYCGNLQNTTDPWKWLRSNKTEGPCCPNGHIYGWFGRRLNDTAPLMDVEITSNGERMPPFQIKYLMRALLKKKGMKSQYDIIILGDSTQRQLFYGFLCGFVRVGGNVTTCFTRDPFVHYEHPLCTKGGPVIKGEISATIEFPPDGVTYSRHRTYRIRYFRDMPSAAKAVQSTPDIFLINLGVHSKSEQKLQEWLTIALDNFQNMSSSLIWRDSTIQHFPSMDGAYETLIDQQETVSCMDLTNPRQKTVWRQTAPRDWLSKNAPYVPILALNETEQHYYKTYPRAIVKRGKLKVDCTHHIYTPMYFDSIFRRLAEILPSSNNNSTGR